jgi:hypothetical protein
MFGKFDGLDRLTQALLIIGALYGVGNGIFMLVEPIGWYNFIDTVKATGPANEHFIKDVGIAFLVSGMLLIYAAINPIMRWGTAVVGNLYLTFHGVLHIYEVLAGICSPDIFWQDAPGVLGFPLLVWIGIGILLARQRISAAPLPKPLFLKAAKQISAPADAYLDDIANAGGFTMEAFQHFSVLSGHYYNAPPKFMLMTMLGSTHAEDCGPCLEIVRGYAEGAGIHSSRIENALTGKPDSEADKLAYNFGAAIASGDIATAAELGDEIEAQFGRPVRTELSLAASTSRVYPAIKRGLGHASACAIPRAV